MKLQERFKKFFTRSNITFTTLVVILALVVFNFQSIKSTFFPPHYMQVEAERVLNPYTTNLKVDLNEHSDRIMVLVQSDKRLSAKQIAILKNWLNKKRRRTDSKKSVYVRANQRFRYAQYLYWFFSFSVFFVLAVGFRLIFSFVEDFRFGKTKKPGSVINVNFSQKRNARETAQSEDIETNEDNDVSDWLKQPTSALKEDTTVSPIASGPDFSSTADKNKAELEKEIARLKNEINGIHFIWSQSQQEHTGTKKENEELKSEIGLLNDKIKQLSLKLEETKTMASYSSTISSEIASLDFTDALPDVQTETIDNNQDKDSLEDYFTLKSL